MIHYTCDRCKREIDASCETRYTVQIEVQANGDSNRSDFDEDIDHLTELHQILEGIADDDFDFQLSEANHRGSYDLCPDCHRQFLKNPLGRDAVLALGFSNN
ncbi:hypothetical protein [Novipirellula artificiosorum]|uniref:Uncharacterized protein n=1 Tax=Novipirellula artificiosorum TaxID=2528016 RepID=A0A5C6D7G4_9BACT|nr:hypothetical protein [Novipirellula artificiosorum]TWU32872.1 hypothetical protein Poly41_52490 [Novipirellula artificiosorum]